MAHFSSANSAIESVTVLVPHFFASTVLSVKYRSKMFLKLSPKEKVISLVASVVKSTLFCLNS